MVRMGSLFAGIGGFELGAEMAFDEAGIPHQTLWQVEQNKYCQKVLARHWSSAKIYDDVRDITKDNVAPVDVIMAGFPCQDISSAGLQRGIYEGKKSSLWWEVWRIARDLRPRVLVLENVANILRLGGSDVVGSLASIGYGCEWSIVSARERGACHLRERWFCVAYTDHIRGHEDRQPNQAIKTQKASKGHQDRSRACDIGVEGHCVAHPSGDRGDLHGAKNKKGNCVSKSGPINTIKGTWKKDTVRREGSIDLLSQPTHAKSGSPSHRDTIIEAKEDREGWANAEKSRKQHPRDLQSTFWQRHPHPSAFCRVDDGIPDRSHRLKALGNAIVPQCSQYVFECIIKSGLLS